MNTCDQAQVWTTSHCQDQATPRLIVQNLTFADGNSTGETVDGGGGGAIFVRGGRFKIVNSTFSGNRCDRDRARPRRRRRPRAARSTTGLPGVRASTAASRGNVCSNGGALSSIGVSWNVAQQPVQRQPRDRQRRQPGPSRHARRRQRRRDLQRRQPVHAHASPAADHGRQPRRTRAAARSSSSATTAPARWRSRDSVLRDNPQRRLRDRRPARHLLPRRRPARDRPLRPALSGVGPEPLGASPVSLPPGRAWCAHASGAEPLPADDLAPTRLAPAATTVARRRGARERAMVDGWRSRDRGRPTSRPSSS